MNIYNYLIRYFKVNYSLIIAFSLFIILELPFLDNSRPILVDEAWYANPSYNFVISHSFNNTNVGFGGNGLIVFSIYLSTYFYIFGASLFTARLSSFFLGLISILIVRKLLKIFNASEFNIFLSLSFFIFANLYLSIFKIARPEALAFTLSLCLLLSLYYYLKRNYSTKFLLLLIFISFLALNSHPNSTIIILLTFIIILYFIIKNSEYKKIYHLVLLTTGVAFSSFFLIFIISLNNNVSLNDSLLTVMQRSSATSSFLENLISKINVTFDYFILSTRIITFLPQILLMAAGLFYFKNYKFLFGFSLCGIVSLSIAFIFISSIAFIYIYPYVFVFSVFVLSLLLGAVEERKLIKKIILVFVISVISLNIIAYITLTKKTYDPEINKKKKEINSLLPQNSTIISGPAFWFISPAKDIKAWEYFKDIDELKKNKNFYIINCDKFSNDNLSDKNSIAQFNLINSSYNADTLLSKNSNIYGNIYLIKFTNK